MQAAMVYQPGDIHQLHYRLSTFASSPSVRTSSVHFPNVSSPSPTRAQAAANVARCQCCVHTSLVPIPAAVGKGGKIAGTRLPSHAPAAAGVGFETHPATAWASVVC